MILICTWKIHDGKHGDVYTYFSSLPKPIDNPDCLTVARFHNPGNATGTAIVKARNFACAWKAEMMQWEDVADMVTKPMLDDNEAREILLHGEKPSYMISDDTMDMEPPEGYSLYKASWKATSQEDKAKMYEIFANLSEEADTADKGDNIVLCRYHDLTPGEGFTIFASPDATANMSINKWTSNWRSVCEVHVEPVLTDAQLIQCIKETPGYEEKLEEVKMKMGKK
jgi:hypothetical protein